MGDPNAVATMPMMGGAGSRLASWSLFVLCCLAAVPGVVVAAAAFSVFERIYSFLPWTDVILVAGYGAFLSRILAYAARERRRTADSPVFAYALATGFALAYYTMGGWELSTAAFVFPAASLLAYVGVAETTCAVGRKKVGWGLATAFAALGLGLVPAVVIVSGIWTAVLYYPDIIREVGFAAMLALSASATFLGLAAGHVPNSSRSPTAPPR